MASDRRPRQVTRRLNQVTPSGAHHVRNFFADGAHKGAGRALLGAVCRLADEAGHVLYLDTVVDRLVAYYAEFGFEVRAVSELTRGGKTVLSHRMVREPRALAALRS